MYYCLLRELVYHLNLNYTKFRLAFLEVSSCRYICSEYLMVEFLIGIRGWGQQLSYESSPPQ